MNHNVRLHSLELRPHFGLMGDIHGKQRAAWNLDRMRMVASPNLMLAARQPHETMAEHTTAAGDDDPHEANQPVAARMDRIASLSKRCAVSELYSENLTNASLL